MEWNGPLQILVGNFGHFTSYFIGLTLETNLNRCCFTELLRVGSKTIKTTKWTSSRARLGRVKIINRLFLNPFSNIFFGLTCPFPLSLLLSLFFCHQVVHLIHLVLKWTQKWNSRSKTMAQTVSPWRSPPECFPNIQQTLKHLIS